MDIMRFGAERVIKQHISEADLATYFVGFDIDDNSQRYYRLESLVDLLVKVVPEFAFGCNQGMQVNITVIAPMLRDAAKAIYKIKEFEKVKEIYESGDSISDDGTEKQLYQRGEFGELILHLLLRDFHNTIPLLSKIYFKDSYGTNVHGFDAVHVQPATKTLWLGESKIYTDGKKGVKALVKDVKEHFQRDYLRDEFTIVSKKLKLLNIPEKDMWLKLMDEKTTLIELFKSVNIPLLCTYTSENFTKFNDEKLQAFIDAYEKEVRGLKEYFEGNLKGYKQRTNLNIILFLFPVKSKNELVKRMHEKIDHLQGI